MKKLLSTCLALTLFTLVCHAAEYEFFYGMWHATWTASPGTAKEAGELRAWLNNFPNAADFGSIDIDGTVGKGVDQQGQFTMTTYHFHGTWTRSPVNRNIVNIVVPAVLPGDTSFKGKFNVVSGALTGTYVVLGLERGKFQMTRQTRN